MAVGFWNASPDDRWLLHDHFRAVFESIDPRWTDDALLLALNDVKM